MARWTGQATGARPGAALDAALRVRLARRAALITHEIVEPFLKVRSAEVA